MDKMCKNHIKYPSQISCLSTLCALLRLLVVPVHYQHMFHYLETFYKRTWLCGIERAVPRLWVHFQEHIFYICNIILVACVCVYYFSYFVTGVKHWRLCYWHLARTSFFNVPCDLSVSERGKHPPPSPVRRTHALDETRYIHGWRRHEFMSTIDSSGWDLSHV